MIFHLQNLKKFFQNKIFLFILAILLISIALWYWHYTQSYVSSDDAYVNANIVEVAPRVSGQVIHLYVVNNQFVQKNQLLFELDQDPYKIAVAKASAELDMADADLIHSKITTHRTDILVKTKVLAMQSHDDALARYENAVAGVALAKTILAEAKLNLLYTKVFAASNGWISNMTLRAGNNVIANQPLFALISDNEFWVDANFKETELENVRPGQKAIIHVDMYPNYAFYGIVESISGGSGAAFSLLPPQNATGNWVKVTQRVPVKIRIINIDKNHLLRVGTTASVTIKTI